MCGCEERMKTVVYKLTSQDMTTYGGFRWELGIPAETSGDGDLCGPGWLHCYSDPLLAVMLNPIHGNIDNPRLFRAEAGGKSQHDHGIKSGYTRMTLVEEIPVPAVTTEQRIRFAILCSLKVYSDPAYVKWAEGWLSGEDRSKSAAGAAAREAEVAAEAAAREAEVAASWAAAWAAAGAARAAAWAARAARAARAAAGAARAAAGAARAAVGAARAAEEAAEEAAARVAALAAWEAADLDLVAIAHEACEVMG